MDVAEASGPAVGALAHEGRVLLAASTSVLAGGGSAPVHWNLGGRVVKKRKRVIDHPENPSVLILKGTFLEALLMCD